MAVALCITVAVAALALVAGYLVLRHLRKYGFIISGAAMVSIAFLASIALLYALPLIGYVVTLPEWTMSALFYGLAGMLFVLAAAFLDRWARRRLPLEKKETLAFHEDTDYPEHL